MEIINRKLTKGELMPFKYGQNHVFVEGRGGGRGLPVENDTQKQREGFDILTEGEQIDGLGAYSEDNGAKPQWATGEATAFHTGRGLGRGHGPETAKNA
jgi:hypothetical protein